MVAHLQDSRVSSGHLRAQPAMGSAPSSGAAWGVAGVSTAVAAMGLAMSSRSAKAGTAQGVLPWLDLMSGSFLRATSLRDGNGWKKASSVEDRDEFSI